jgi:succinate-semialdehyde dehydrogenase/glutarate-semialdehyde dehydrogenase
LFKLGATLFTHEIMLRSINPYDQSLIAEFPFDTPGQVTAKIEKAAKAFSSWKKESFAQRAALLKKAGELVRKNKESYARIISTEMGKIVEESRHELEKCAIACNYFAERAEGYLKDTIIVTEASKSYVCYQPLGPVLAIMPWNFPMWQVFRFAAPSLMAGNVGLLKHAANVTQCALIIEKIFLEAGFPEGVFQSLLIDSKDVEAVIAHDAIHAVTLTGSEYAGTKVASAAGRYLKKSVLELGGSDPFIVLEDADLELAATVATQSRMRNAGQSCIAAKRFIVVPKIKDEFIQRFQQKVTALRQGDQFNPQIDMGPMARLDLAEQLERQLQKSLQQGASILMGGNRKGANFQPTLIDGVKPGMVAFEEEMFGPVAAIIHAKDDREAVTLANNSRFGLGASVWTNDKERGERIALQLESGSVFVNALMKSDQRLPFGGIKKSGYGRELAEMGIKEFVNAKTISIQ